MAFGFKIPKMGGAKKKPAGDELTISSIMPPPIPIMVGRPASRGGLGGGASRTLSLPKIPLPKSLLAKPMEEQMKILGGIFIGLLFMLLVLVLYDNKKTTDGTAYMNGAGELRMLSQRLAMAAAQANEGNPTAFARLKDAQQKFGELLVRLEKGGEVAGVKVPRSPSAVSNQIAALTKLWEDVEKASSAMLAQEQALIGFGQNVAIINWKQPVLRESFERFGNQKGGVLIERIAHLAVEVQKGDAVKPEVAAQMTKDLATLKDVVASVVRGNESKAGELEAAFGEYGNAVGNIVSGLPGLTETKQSGAVIEQNNEPLLQAADELAQAYQKALSSRMLYVAMLLLTALAAIVTLSMLAKLYLDETRRRADEAETQRQESESTNRENQDAILRLMNELGDLADGDLTVTATVSENITGAIADSINYTIEELRVLVGRINDAANRVTAATEIARQTSSELLDAAARQSEEIREAGRSALVMAGSMTQVSGDAGQSALVARQSLSAAEKGTLAVQDSIKGMNEIRGHIQETSKRIKRLGESSQEIGEIVELISDITEQTNVLALNAAIQAASAGEAGRGFTVVAEEVQRLAERSAEATKQIAAIVKTIQTDTQDAVAAMEQSTQGVVDGARLSDAAGQALAEIGEVSRNLAGLIESISSSTQEQADSATQVAEKMQEILRITDQTTAGTKRTAEAVDELTSLAAELKGSVAGFKTA